MPALRGELFIGEEAAWAFPSAPEMVVAVRVVPAAAPVMCSLQLAQEDACT